MTVRPEAFGLTATGVTFLLLSVTLLWMVQSDLSLRSVSAFGTAATVLLLVAAWRLSRDSLGLIPAVCVAWVVYFPARLIAIESDRHSPDYHPALASANDAQLVWIWMMSVAGLALFVAGASLYRRSAAPRWQRYEARLKTAEYRTIAVAGLVLSAALTLGHLQSGILGNIANLELFGAAGVAYEWAQTRRHGLFLFGITASASVLGFIADFKQLAVFPLLAVGIGAWSGWRSIGRRIKLTHLALAAAALLSAYLAVATERIIATRDVVAAVSREIEVARDFDLASGNPLGRTAPLTAVPSNIIRGISQRFDGVTSLIVIRDKVPVPIPYLHAKEIVEPAISVLPGVKNFGHLEFAKLSTGGYFDQVFYSLQPLQDPSSQAMTWPGDLYINFGVAGIAAGMLLIGFLIRLLDCLADLRTALGAAVFTYFGTVVIGVEGNIAFIGVNALIRVGIMTAVLSILGTLHKTRRVAVKTP